VRFEYSEAERRLASRYGLDDVMALIAPSAFYRLMVERAFLMNSGGAADESLRRCVRAMNASFPHRMTPAWDAMIELDDDD
jgi:hypothetical protein